MKKMEDEVKVKLEDFEKRLENMEERISELEEEAIFNEEAMDKSLTLPEFMRDKDVRYHKDKILRIAYYLEKYKDMGSFKTADIKEGYKKCRFDLPANITDIASKLVGDGLFGEEKEGGTKKWFLTKTGVNEVEEEIENE